MVALAIKSPEEISSELAQKLREHRLAQGLTLLGLSQRSGVPLGTLKKFERTGQVSLVSFIRLVIALKQEAVLEQFLHPSEYETLEQVLAKPQKPSRGRIT